ncbi:MAG TPA: aldo/keto reductase [Croceibacterium sp.]|jgi:aryl-alcohol dehydrogenase-like predicted oxidoreductase
MQTVKLGKSGPEVSRVGLGCMAMSGTYGPADRREAIATIHAALDAGITLIDTGDFYGMGHNEMLIGEALKSVPRDRYQLSVKFGALRDAGNGWSGNDARPAAVKNFLAYTLQRLGVDHIDIYRPARLDPDVPIEDTVGAIAECIEAGWVRHVGLSEVGPETLRRASAVRPIADLQIEYALTTRNIERAVLPVCRELGIGLTVYGVFGRGLLTGGWRPGELSPNDFRNHAPRFQGEAGARNANVAAEIDRIAAGFGMTAGQVLLAWVVAQGEDIVPLVGARRPSRVVEAVKALKKGLTPEQLTALEAAIPADAIQGERYAPAQMAQLDSERG